jgi:hypothetical protein
MKTLTHCVLLFFIFIGTGIVSADLTNILYSNTGEKSSSVTDSVLGGSKTNDQYEMAKNRISEIYHDSMMRIDEMIGNEDSRLFHNTEKLKYKGKLDAYYGKDMARDSMNDHENKAKSMYEKLKQWTGMTADTVEDKASDARDSIKDTASSASDKVKEMGQTVSDKASNVGQTLTDVKDNIKDTASDVKDTASTKASDLSAYLSFLASDARERSSRTFDNLKSYGKDTFSSTSPTIFESFGRDFAKGIMNELSYRFGTQPYEFLKSTLNSQVNKASETAATAKNAASDVMEEGKETVEDVKGKGKDLYEEGKAKVDETIQEGKGKASETIQSNKGKVNDKIQETKDRASRFYEESKAKAAKATEKGKEKVDETKESIHDKTGVNPDDIATGKESFFDKVKETVKGATSSK